MADTEEAGNAQHTASDVHRSPKFLRTLSAKASDYHGRVPGIRKLPFPAVAIIVALIVANLCVWIAAGIVLHFHPSLISTAVLSYTLGLRHALDADHISAIDLMTRRLIITGRRPVTVGLFFSLGHSTIVIITSVVVAATASAVSHKFGAFSRVGNIIGTSVSAGFLILLGIMNAYILYKLIIQLKREINMHPDEDQGFKVRGGGCLFHIFKKMFKLIDRPWKMYPLGILFGLGFDTSSEIALLGISSIEATSGAASHPGSFWLILLFPILFTAGMALLDTTDGALMLALYSSVALAKDRIATLYYGAVLTGLTVAVACVIGVIQLLSLIDGVASPTGKFWEGVESAGDHYDIIGGAICASFVLIGCLSILIYKPWRRRIDRYREQRFGPSLAGQEAATELHDLSTADDLKSKDLDAKIHHGEIETVPTIAEAESSRTQDRSNGTDSRRGEGVKGGASIDKIEEME
ncbi:MAG: hypothetical protein M1820_001804 [Bogoriella megaspora]|nr:MAG: hypothetical protein M1820_001804 [Bogoriella megaspora]